MILWCDGGHTARENMRRDALLLERLEAARDGDPGAEAVLRLFRFTPPGITLGRAQDPERTLDLERCRADRVEWAVRPTGGRAIYHDDEWTYSFAARIADDAWGGGLLEAYGRVSRLVHASLVELGVPAELVAQRGSRTPRTGRETGVPRNGSTNGSPNRSTETPPDDPGRASCFASTARHEIELDGRKLVGSAQRRTATALLQQGSVLLGESHLRLAAYLRLPGEASHAARRALEVNAGPGGVHLGPERGLERWAAAMMGILGPRVRTIYAEAGADLLTPAEPAPYTAGSCK